MTRSSWPKLLLLCAAIILFCGSLDSGFHFDDYAIFQDAAIRAPNGWLAVWNFRQTRPLTRLTFWVELPAGRRESHWISRAGTLALRAFEGADRFIIGEHRRAAALLFAVHPRQAEAVNYVWARSIVLAVVFHFRRVVPGVCGIRRGRGPGLLADELA